MTAHLDDICDIRRLHQAVDDGLVSRREHPDGDLVIYNYTPAAQYTPGSFDLWEVRVARGLITDQTGRIVGRGFPKFGGVHEHGPDSPYGPIPVGEDHTITEKLDGSLGIVFRWNGQLLVTTRGTFTSEQARWAQHWLDQHVPSKQLDSVDGTTSLCVEILSPVSQVVIRYPKHQLVALTAIDHHSGNDRPIPDDWPGERVAEHHGLDIGDVLAAHGQNPPGSAGREGYVIRFQPSNTRVKVKFGDYLRLHRTLGGLTRRAVWERWAIRLLRAHPTVTSKTIARAVHLPAEEVDALAGSPDPIGELLAVVGDEAAGLIATEVAHLDADYAEHRHKFDRALAQAKTVPRREVATLLDESPYLHSVFAALSGKHPDLTLVRMVERPPEALHGSNDRTTQRPTASR